MVLKPSKELHRCTTPPHVFLQRFKQPSSFPALIPVPLCWHSCLFGWEEASGGVGELLVPDSAPLPVQVHGRSSGDKTLQFSGHIQVTRVFFFQDIWSVIAVVFQMPLYGHSLVNVDLFTATAVYWFSLET